MGHTQTERKNTMNKSKQQLVIVSTRGLDDERGTVAWTIANNGLASGIEVTMFLTSTAVDLVRKGGVRDVRVNPFDPPLNELIESFVEAGGQIWVCPPCAEVRGYQQADLLDAAEIKGSRALHELIKGGASTLSF
jgi:predicted peroxiredoxin